MTNSTSETLTKTQTTEAFHFTSKLSLTLLTGKKARDLAELLEYIKTLPESSIYYHTHRFLQQHHYLSPEPPNDFAFWITNILQENILGEQVAAIDIIQTPSISALRDRLVATIENYLNIHPNLRTAPPGEEFYFMSAITFMLPTPYYATNLEEFCSALQKVSLESLYFHVFEARLRLVRGTNDFSLWFRNQLGEEKLAQAIEGLDPYTHTLDSLRGRICAMIQKRLKELNYAHA
jgi:hypothetical protein